MNFEEIVAEADRRMLDTIAHPDQDHPGWDSREDMRMEPEWVDLLIRIVAEQITELCENLGGFFTPEGPAPAAREAWFGEDFNYQRTDEGWAGWNSAFLYNGSEGMLSMVRAVAYEFVRRGYLLPHAVGKNTHDFKEGGSLA